jgi:hypothetical protein
MNDNELFASGPWSIASNDGSGVVGNFLSSDPDRAVWGFRAASSTLTVRAGIDDDRFIVLFDNTPKLIMDGTRFSLNDVVFSYLARQYLAAALAKTNDTLADVFTAVALQAAKKYAFRAVLQVTAGATGGHKYQVHASGGLTAAATLYHITSFRDDDSSGTVKLFVRKTALDSSSGEASQTGYKTIIEGTILVGVAGNFNIQFAQNVTDAGASSVLAGSSLEVWELT